MAARKKSTSTPYSPITFSSRVRKSSSTIPPPLSLDLSLEDLEKESESLTAVEIPEIKREGKSTFLYVRNVPASYVIDRWYKSDKAAEGTNDKTGGTAGSVAETKTGGKSASDFDIIDAIINLVVHKDGSQFFVGADARTKVERMPATIFGRLSRAVMDKINTKDTTDEGEG